MRIIWAEQARQEWATQYRFYYGRKTETARRMRKRVQNRVRWLQQNPKGGRPGYIEGTRELVITGTPWLIVYQDNAIQVEILHFYHGRQDWQRDMESSHREEKNKAGDEAPGASEAGPEDV